MAPGKGFWGYFPCILCRFCKSEIHLVSGIPDLPFIFPTQLQRDVIETLNSNSSKLTGRHKRL